MKSLLGNTTKSDPTYVRDPEFADYSIKLHDDGSRSAVAGGLSLMVLPDADDIYMRHRRGVQPVRNRHFSTLIATLDGVNLYVKPHPEGGHQIVMTTQKLQVS